MFVQFEIPELEYFTIEEIADQWQWSVRDVEYLIFQEKTLRPAIVTATIKEFLDDPDLWSFITVEIDAFRKSGKKFPKLVDDYELDYVMNLERLPAQSGPYQITELPDFIYPDLASETSTVQLADSFVALRRVQLSRSNFFALDEFEGFNGDIFMAARDTVGEGVCPLAVAAPAETFVITREERDRYIEANAPVALEVDESKGPNAAILIKNIRRTIGALVIGIKKESGDRFIRRDRIDFKSLASYVVGFAEKPIPVSVDDVAKEIRQIIGNDEVSEDFTARGVTSRGGRN